MQLSDMKIGNVYTFSTYSSTFLSSKISRAKLLAKLDAATARIFAPIDQLYHQVFPSLPPGAVENINGQTYFLFQEQNGSKIVMAEQWLIESSLLEITNVSLQIRIENGDTTTSDKASRALRAVGITDFSISIQQITRVA